MTKKKISWLVGIAALSFGIAWALYFRERLPVLTPQIYSAAKSQWEARGPKDYELDVEVSGVQAGHYRIQVKDRNVVQMKEDGIDVPERVWAYWSVDGMFRFLEEELASKKRPSAAYGVSDPDSVYLQADFDEKLGYPKRFLRQVFGRKLTIEWRAQVLGGDKAN